MSDAKIRLARGRALARQRMPYLYHALLSLIPIKVDEPEGTCFVTPGLVLGYSPKFVESLDDATLAGVLLHEVSHIVRGTLERIPDGDPFLKNLASDIAINSSLRTAKISLPDKVAYPETYQLPEHQTMEVYYDLLSQMKLEDEPSLCAGKCGGIAGNGDRDTENELDKLYGRPALDRRAVKEICLRDLQSKMAGKVSADIQEIIDITLSTGKINWKTRLRRLLNQHTNHLAQGATDLSLRRPDKRSFVRNDGIVHPGAVGYEPNLLLCLDVSGSMQEKELTAAAIEIASVLHLSQTHELWLLQADLKVKGRPQRITVNDLRSLKIKGRGGTDFAPAIQYAEKLRPKPDILIYFTDGYGPAPKKEPRMKVIWCLIGNISAPAPWGETIFVEGP